MSSRKRPIKELKVNLTYSSTSSEDAKAERRVLKVPSVDVAALRQKTGLSQHAFALSIGVSEGTLMNWEQGRRFPSGPAKVLLALLAKKPSLVEELLSVRQSQTVSPIDHMTDEERFAEIGRILAAGIIRLHKHEGNETSPNGMGESA